ncbi:uncharacterized protein FTOL_13142 [Fusarium torulosum]|uniref:Uncharacterized protein n=1 Tax=Fusarium torulosum TaxID=33205 RepID=A0AAE8SPJ8_9HYPO|nr:uncharacterized protein FTOL_13142 [Fusarium torulosum]
MTYPGRKARLGRSVPRCPMLRHYIDKTDCRTGCPFPRNKCKADRPVKTH